MLANIIVGVILIVVIGSATYKSYQDMKHNKCSCGSTCSNKSKCHKKDIVMFK